LSVIYFFLHPRMTSPTSRRCISCSIETWKNGVWHRQACCKNQNDAVYITTDQQMHKLCIVHCQESPEWVGNILRRSCAILNYSPTAPGKAKESVKEISMDVRSLYLD
jgi:hypothetical protein